MVRRCWVNFQCRGVLLIWIIVGQGPIALAVGAGGGCLDIFSLIYHFSFLSPSLWETARYRLKYCLKGPLSPKQPTNQSIFMAAKVACNADHCWSRRFTHFSRDSYLAAQCLINFNGSVSVHVRNSLYSCFLSELWKKWKYTSTSRFSTGSGRVFIAFWAAIFARWHTQPMFMMSGFFSVTLDNTLLFLSTITLPLSLA